MTAPVFRAVWSMSLAGGALTLLALALTPFTRRRFPPGWHRGLYLAVLGLYALPVGVGASALKPLLASPVSEALPGIEFPAPLDFVPVGNETAATASVWPSLLEGASWLWLGIAVLLLGIRLAGLRRFKGTLLKSSVATDGLSWPGNTPTLPVRTSPLVGTPMLVGIWRPVLFLPATSWREGELDLVLRHELAHFRQGDMLFKGAGLVLRCLHWFNPLIYLATARLDKWMELNSDSVVTAGMDFAGRRAYGMMILDTLGRPVGEHVGATAALGGEKSHTKERLMAILKHNNSTGPRKVISCALTAALCAAGIGLAALAYVPAQAQAAEPPVSQAEPAGPPTPLTKEEIIAVQEEAAAQKKAEAPTAFLWPAEGGVGYLANGLNAYPGHTGIDIAAPQGTAIYATADGVVTRRKELYYGYGRYLIIDHGGGYQSLYGHCNELLVEEGDEVTAGQLIARIGKSGNATGNQLHFEIRLDGIYMDPEDYVSQD